MSSGRPTAFIDLTSAANSPLDARLDLGNVNWDSAVLVFMTQSNPGVGVGFLTITDDLGVNLFVDFPRRFDATHVNLFIVLGAIEGAASYVIQASPTEGWSGGSYDRLAGLGARKPAFLDFHIDALGVGILSRLSVIAERAAPSP